MKTLNIEQSTLDVCLASARHERVVLTRNGQPIALLVNVEGLDAEQIELGSSDKFWKIIAERRAQPTLSREELERKLL
ncbi:MAG TPA: hypothetical protein VFF59_11975 [Anaerolineae bacterium]|nr:hypothetical protein [Anaerolineae bacterium]